MKPLLLIRWLFLAFAFAGFAAGSSATAVPGDPRQKAMARYPEPFSRSPDSAIRWTLRLPRPSMIPPVSAYPPMPPCPSQNFEGTLTLSNPATEVQVPSVSTEVEGYEERQRLALHAP